MYLVDSYSILVSWFFVPGLHAGVLISLFIPQLSTLPLHSNFKQIITNTLFLNWAASDLNEWPTGQPQGDNARVLVNSPLPTPVHVCFLVLCSLFPLVRKHVRCEQISVTKVPDWWRQENHSL